MQQQPKYFDASRQVLIALVVCLTLGLAPFLPEPHIVGKVRWVLGGGEGMGALDYFDLVLHGAPWVWLLITIVIFVVGRLRGPRDDGAAAP